jgi:hypothetical protein
MKKQTRLDALRRQIDRLERQQAALQGLSHRYAWVRFAIFFGGLLAAGLALYAGGAWLAGLCLVVAGLLFGLAVYAHSRVRHSIRRHRLLRRHKATQIARATLDWERIPIPPGPRPRPEHPFETDLDLAGGRSLHRLLDTAVSYEGSQRLREWLTTPVPDGAQVQRRQELARELAPRNLFRERLTLRATLAAGTARTWKATPVLDWLARPAAESELRRWLLVQGAWVVLNAGLLIANRLGLLPPWWTISLAAYLGVWLLRTRTIETTWDEALSLESSLRQLGGIFARLETFWYGDTPHLQALCAPFQDSEHRPSRYLGRITRVVTALSLRANPLLALGLNLLLPWDAFFAYLLGRYKADVGQRAPVWMDVWFELEALGALANFAYLNPGYTWPRIVPGEESGPIFCAQDLGHPLIPDGDKVCNDFTLPELGRVAIITGSNMAGKSVFLKTVGVNLALAYAGGPVNAAELQTVLFRLYTCMGIADSVTDGISYFYAEVKRLKALLTGLEGDHELPLLFGIDEIFRGTNNRERLIGSRAYVRALAGKNGAGFIATHDLELAQLADEMPPVENYHFRDHVEGGRMAFDYTLRPGPCPTTNALKIMELEGLPL